MLICKLVDQDRQLMTKQCRLLSSIVCMIVRSVNNIVFLGFQDENCKFPITIQGTRINDLEFVVFYFILSLSMLAKEIYRLDFIHMSNTFFFFCLNEVTTHHPRILPHLTPLHLISSHLTSSHPVLSVSRTHLSTFAPPLSPSPQVCGG